MTTLTITSTEVAAAAATGLCVGTIVPAQYAGTFQRSDRYWTFTGYITHVPVKDLRLSPGTSAALDAILNWHRRGNPDA